MKERKGHGFSLIELLMVLGVMGILMGMMIPSVGIVREKAQRMVTGQKLRQVGLAVATYHSVTGRSLAAEDLGGWIRGLARETGLRESDVFLLGEDPMVRSLVGTLPPVLVEKDTGGEWHLIEGFGDLPLGLAVASGVSAFAPPATTPIAWTRGLTVEGRWLEPPSTRAGVYGGEGGFIVFLDGRVQFFRDLSADGGQLVSHDTGQRTDDIREALGPGVKGYDYLGRVF